MTEIMNSTSQVIWISAGLWGKGLDPDEISVALEIKATTSYKKGDVKKLSSGNFSLPREMGMWKFRQNLNDSIEKGLEGFISKFEDKQVLALKNVQHAILDLYLGISDCESKLEQSTEFRIEQKLLLQIASLGFDIRITVS